MTGKSFRMLSQAFAQSAFLAITALALPVQAVAQDSVYDFSGSCADCANTGNGVLTLQNYTAGTALTASDFVSLTYASNLLTFTITQSELDYTATGSAPVVSGPISTGIILMGALGSTAGSADFYLNASNGGGSIDYSINFDTCSSTSLVCGATVPEGPGGWNILTGAAGDPTLPGGLGGKISNDYGFSHTWTPVSAAAVAAPEINAGSGVGAVSLLLSALAVLRGRRAR